MIRWNCDSDNRIQNKADDKTKDKHRRSSGTKKGSCESYIKFRRLSRASGEDVQHLIVSAHLQHNHATSGTSQSLFPIVKELSIRQYGTDSRENLLPSTVRNRIHSDITRMCGNYDHKNRGLATTERDIINLLRDLRARPDGRSSISIKLKLPPSLSST